MGFLVNYLTYLPIYLLHWLFFMLNYMVQR